MAKGRSAAQPAAENTAETPSGIEFAGHIQSDIGCKRATNEDACVFVRPADPEALANRGVLLLVADGMGGHAFGELASQMAVEIVPRVYYSSTAEAQPALIEAFQAANREIHDRALAEQTTKGMGTTCTGLALTEHWALAAHVGDSRLYRVRDGRIRQLTDDHTEVMELARRGWISQEDARNHPAKNILARAVGVEADVEVSTWFEDSPLPGDTFVLCSDGLHNPVSDEEIGSAILAYSPADACRTLIELARERGGPDNITVGVVSMRMKSESIPQPLRTAGAF